MVVQVKATSTAPAVTYNDVVGLACNDKSVSIIQNTASGTAATQPFDFPYSVTVIK